MNFARDGPEGRAAGVGGCGDLARPASCCRAAARKHVDIDESMVRVIARQAEAERERRAKVISAEGEQQAAQKIYEAALILGQKPEAMQLRYLSALSVIANDRSNTIVFPFPLDAGPMLSALGAKR